LRCNDIKKLFKITKKILFIALSLILIFLCVSAIYNRIMLDLEADKLMPPGKMVDVGGHRLHVYTEGSRNNTPSLVFMSGSATVSPVYNFKPLYSLLSDKYRIIVIEEAGYGYSDIYATPRDAESKLSNIRRALSLAGENVPYILIPHSMSGIEALYWAQNYPDEIKGIIGLDMAVPDSYQNYNFSDFGFRAEIRIAQIASWLGLLRIPGLYPIYAKGLSADEIEQQKLLLYRNAFNIDYIDEGKSIKANADIVKNGKIPDIPYLMFTSNGKETGRDWIACENNFAKSVNAGLVSLDCSHYIFQYQPEKIAEKIIEYMRQF